MNVISYQLLLTVFMAFAMVASSGTTIGSLRVLSASTVPLDEQDVPFYLTFDEKGNTIAVIFYGEIGDKSKEILVPCTEGNVEENPYAAPHPTLCHCTSDTQCTLEVPYAFLRDASGTVTGVTYVSSMNEADDSLVVGFRPIKDANGVTIGAIFDDEDESSILVVPFHAVTDANGTIVAVEVSDQSSSVSYFRNQSLFCIVAKSVLGVCLIVLVVLLIVLLRIRSKEALAAAAAKDVEKTESDAKVGTTGNDDNDNDDDTEAGSSIVDRN